MYINSCFYGFTLDEILLKMANPSYTPPAYSSSGFQTAVWTVKLVFLLTGAVSTVIAFKEAVIPCASYLAVSTLPGLWVFITSLLFPPYIYIVFNFIVVVTVAASTTFNNHRRHHQPQHPQVVVPDGLQPPGRSLSQSPTRLQSSESLSSLMSSDDVSQEVAAGGDQKPIEIRSCSSRLTDDGGEDEEEAAMTMLQGDTMEDVWRAIMEKKKPVRQLKKCDTWDTPPRVAVAAEDEVHSAAAEAAPSRRRGVKEKSMRKWETRKFNGGNGVQASPRPGTGRVVRREVLPSRDDFNRRVEAFIANQHNNYRQEMIVVNQ